MVNIIASVLLDIWILLAVINKGSEVASDVPYYFNKLRQDYHNNQIGEEGLGSLIKESKVHLKKVEEEIETIKNDNVGSESGINDDFEVIDKDLVIKEKYRDELKKLIHDWEIGLSRMTNGKSEYLTNLYNK